MMHHVKKNAQFFKEVSQKDKSAMNAIMTQFRLSKRAEINSVDVATGATAFAKLVSETNFDFVAKCFEPEAMVAAHEKMIAA